MPNQMLAMRHRGQRDRGIRQPVNRRIDQPQAGEREIHDAVFGGEQPFPQRADDQRRQHPGRQQQAAQIVRAGKLLGEEQRDAKTDPDLADHVDRHEQQRVHQHLAERRIGERLRDSCRGRRTGGRSRRCCRASPPAGSSARCRRSETRPAPADRRPAAPGRDRAAAIARSPWSSLQPFPIRLNRDHERPPAEMAADSCVGAVLSANRCHFAGTCAIPPGQSGVLARIGAIFFAASCSATLAGLAPVSASWMAV